MKRTENQVSGQRRLHCYLRRLLISDFTDQDDVRGLTEHGPNDPGEIESDVVFHFYLVDTRQVVLNRVFGRDDFAVRSVQLVKGRVQCCGLTGAGRAGDEENAVWTFDDRLEPNVVLFTEA